MMIFPFQFKRYLAVLAVVPAVAAGATSPLAMGSWAAVSTTVAPAYDAKGNLVRNERGYGFTYDFENRLTRIFIDDTPANGVFDPGSETVLSEYVVDALGNRVQATIGGKTTYRIYDGSVLLAEYTDLSPNALADTVYVNGMTYMDEKILLRHVASDTEYYYLLKDLYSVAGLVSETGWVHASYAYDAYGNPTMVGPLGDSDNDGDIDLYDFGQFQVCNGSTGV